MVSLNGQEIKMMNDTTILEEYKNLIESYKSLYEETKTSVEVYNKEISSLKDKISTLELDLKIANEKYETLPINYWAVTLKDI